jgi:hypothetical protein
MKKAALLTLLSLCALLAFAQKNAVFFLYKGSIYTAHDSTLNPNITKQVDSNANIHFSIKGKNDFIFNCTYDPTKSQTGYYKLSDILLSPKVYFLSYLTELSSCQFVNQFKDAYSKYKNTTYFIVPVLDGRDDNLCFEVTFPNPFLAPQ